MQALSWQPLFPQLKQVHEALSLVLDVRRKKNRKQRKTQNNGKTYFKIRSPEIVICTIFIWHLTYTKG